MPDKTQSYPANAGLRAVPLYFDAPGGSLFGWYHPPAGKSRDASVVICSPFGVEALFASRALRHLAERLASAGFGVLRYDHFGTGDSPGDEATPQLVGVWKSGVSAALDAVRSFSGARRSAIVAMRFGATLAALASIERGGIDSLVMWAPVASGRRYARELRAFSQTGESADAGVGGILVTPETIADISKLDLTSMERAPASSVLVIPRDDLPDDGIVAARCGELGARVQTGNASGFAAAIVEPHNTVVPREVIGAVTSWLIDRHPTTERVSHRIDEHSRSAVTIDVVSGSATNAVTERPAFLDAGKRLFGIVTEPASQTVAPTSIMLVNAGAVSRIGPHRFYVTLAREWAAAGFRVLRMDIGGIGDSIAGQGMAENDTYPRTASDDIAVGLEALRKMGAKNAVVVGLCSGAHAAYHAALQYASQPALAGVVMINPIVFYWKPGDALDISAWQNYVDSRRLQRVARRREAWAKLVRGQVDVLQVVSTFYQRLMTVTKASINRTQARLNLGPKGDLARDLEKLAEQPVDIAMVFSEGDPGYDQLMLHARHVLGRLRRRANFSLLIVPNADHTFTPLESQKRVRQLLFDHLTKRFA
jgi:predicted alpha/beta hydrolase